MKIKVLIQNYSNLPRTNTASSDPSHIRDQLPDPSPRPRSRLRVSCAPHGRRKSSVNVVSASASTWPRWRRPRRSAEVALAASAAASGVSESHRCRRPRFLPRCRARSEPAFVAPVPPLPNATFTKANSTLPSRIGGSLWSTWTTKSLDSLRLWSCEK